RSSGRSSSPRSRTGWTSSASRRGRSSSSPASCSSPRCSSTRTRSAGARRAGASDPRRRDGRARLRARPRGARGGGVKLEQARAIVDAVLAAAPTPLSVFVADDHGELVAAATMDGAAHDTRLNAQRKASTAPRSHQPSTRALAAKVATQPAERRSFDPFFTFFKGGVAALEGDRRVGAVGVSGLPGEEDERLAREAIAGAGLKAG